MLVSEIYDLCTVFSFIEWFYFISIFFFFFFFFFNIFNHFQFCLDCLSDSDCATGAICLGGECSCNINIPVLVGGIASNTSATCVECSSSDSSECTSIEVCDTVSNICVGECNEISM